MTIQSALLRVTLISLAWLATMEAVQAERFSDIRNTKHNLSANFAGTDPRTVKAGSEGQVCVFCHTPHGATTAAGVPAPLWNRQLSSATYTTYESTSINASVTELRNGPGGTSKLCLSCHDGTLAIGSVNVLAGSPTTIDMTGTNAGKMAVGSGVDTGFTRNLGTDLSNDHPISFTYNSAVAAADGELRTPPYPNSSAPIMGNRLPGGAKPTLPLENNMMQCASCHEPHIRDTTETKSIKFLRLNRFQGGSGPSGDSFSADSDIICLACHSKGVNAWSDSAHAKTDIANETYKTGAGSPAELREFPDSVPVWKAACLNCHDTHTVRGARRLLREGTDSLTSPKSGGASAIEETCYQCHQTNSTSILNTGSAAPNIKSDFTGSSWRHMPITNVEQNVSTEAHDIKDADFTENPISLGKGNLANRHVECTDCHNPHRVVKNRQFNNAGATTGATHLHDSGTQHSNIASGVLRGIWGVEPTYTDNAWMSLPNSYTVKQGDGGNNANTAVTNSYLTREYQICLKCHSDYGYDDNKVYPLGNRPSLGYTGGTPSGTNNLTKYTNQAMEFNAAANSSLTGADQGEASANHRSWHPVLFPTGRTLAARGNIVNHWLAPFSGGSGAYIGNLTMYCSDCHGSATADGTSSPTGGVNAPWGPHGSLKNFILKGDWDLNTGSGQTSGLCFKCHNYSNYATRNSNKSGFCCEKDSNLHGYHADKIGSMKCTWCHIAIPHGWKNKAFLVNLNDVGPEAGKVAGTQVRNGTTAKYNAQPYYLNTILKVKTWYKSGSWVQGACGSKGAPGNNTTGRNWMRDSNENCASP